MSEHEFSPESEDEGGARKSFWEHLQDLRTAIIRSVIAILITLVVCLLLDKEIVGLLEYPIRRMRMFEPDHPTVTIQIGDTKLGPYAVTRDDFKALPPGAAPHAVFRMGTMRIGDQDVATLKLVPQAQGAEPIEVRLLNLSPPEAFLVAFHVGLYAAIVVSSPFWLYYLGGFIVPALKAKERKV